MHALRAVFPRLPPPLLGLPRLRVTCENGGDRRSRKWGLKGLSFVLRRFEQVDIY